MAVVLSDVYIAYLLLFGATLFLVEGLYHLVSDSRAGGPEAVNRRLRLIASGKDRDDVLASLRRSELDPLSQTIVRIIPALRQLTREAGVTVTPKAVLAGAAVITLAVGGILWFTAVLPLPMIFGAAPAVGIAVPVLVLLRLRKRRLDGFGTQMPESLEMMVRSLRSGHPISAAIGMVAGHMPDPAGSEFGIVVDEMTYGADLNEALRNLAARIPHPDLAFFVVAVQIQRQTGGNLAEVLANLATVIRDRFNLKLKVKAITAQGRSSAFIVGLMPLLTIGIMHLAAGRYFREVAGDPMFLPAMGGAAALWLVGLVVIWRIVKFRM